MPIATQTAALLKDRRVILIGLLLLLLTAAAIPFLPDGIDWRMTYRPAALAILSGQSPYDLALSPTAPFLAAPWALIVLAPLAVLPVATGRAILLVLSMVAFLVSAQRLGASPLSAAVFLMSPPVLHGLQNANIEWIPVLGFILPPQVGLFFVLAKPQTGFVVAIFWFVEIWRSQGPVSVLKTFAPVTLALILSFVLFGLWPLAGSGAIGLASPFNASLWPMSIPVGLGLLGASIKRRDVRFAMGASPCLSPYVLFHTWVAPLAGLLKSKTELILAVAGLWIVVILRPLL